MVDIAMGMHYLSEKGFVHRVSVLRSSLKYIIKRCFRCIISIYAYVYVYVKTPMRVIYGKYSMHPENCIFCLSHALTDLLSCVGGLAGAVVMDSDGCV